MLNKSPLPIEMQSSSKGQKTPQVPNLDLDRIHSSNYPRAGEIDKNGAVK